VLSSQPMTSPRERAPQRVGFADFCAAVGLSNIERAAFEADVKFIQGANFDHRPAEQWARMLASFRGRARVNRRV